MEFQETKCESDRHVIADLVDAKLPNNKRRINKKKKKKKRPSIERIKSRSRSSFERIFKKRNFKKRASRGSNLSQLAIIVSRESIRLN